MGLRHTITAHGLAYLAAVWAELERRGEDLSDLRVGLAQYLPAIAAGRIAVEAVATFAGQSTVLKRVARLSLDDQRRLAAGEPVPVVSASADGQYTERSLPLRALTAPQVATVIDEFGRIRTPIEQRQHLRQTARPPRPVATPARTAEIRGAVAAISDDDLRALAASRRLAIVPRRQAGASRKAPGREPSSPACQMVRRLSVPAGIMHFLCLGPPRATTPAGRQCSLPAPRRWRCRTR